MQLADLPDASSTPSLEARRAYLERRRRGSVWLRVSGTAFAMLAAAWLTIAILALLQTR
jgi:hypothetical protein